jgi:diazepam-binding inhibitor (GABA receptor modulating acyl-CoA-binding protein)
MATQAEFEDASKRVKNLPEKPSNEMLLELYSLYKQATSGDVSGDKPAMFDFAGRAKYDAWEDREGMSQDDAMTAYVELVEKLEK